MAIGLLVALALGVALPRYRFGAGLGDEGFLAYGAMRVSAGELPNLDFVSLQPPFAFYALAGVFELFGPTLLVLRQFGVVLHIGIALATYALSRRMMEPAPAVLAAVPVLLTGMPLHNFVPAPVWHGVLACFLSVTLLMLAIARERIGFALAAGCVAAIALLSRHDQGVYLCLSMAAYAVALWAVQRQGGAPVPWRVLLGWWGALAAVLLPLTLWWGWIGALPEMIAQLVVFPLSTYTQTSSLPWPRFEQGASLGSVVYTALYYLPLVAVLAGAEKVAVRLARRRFDREHAQLALITVLSLLFYLQVFTRSDVYHLVIALPPSFAILAWFVALLDRRVATSAPDLQSGRGARAVLWLVVLLTSVFLFFVTRPIFLKLQPSERQVVDLERAGIELPPREARALEEAVAFIERTARPDQSILVLPYQPMYYFLAQRRNPTRWNYLWPGDQTAEDHQALVEQAQSDPPAVLIVTGVERMERYAPSIVEWIRSQYQPVAQLGRATFLLPLQREP